MKLCTKTILHFRSQWPWPLAFRCQTCSPSFSYTGSCLHQVWNSLKFLWLSNFEWHETDGQTDGRTDGRRGSTLNAAF